MEQAFYVLQQDIERVCFAKLLKIVSLSIVFFFGLWLNLILLRIENKILILIVAGIILVFLSGLETFLAYNKTKTAKYNFYQNRIEFKGKSAYYSNIDNVYLKQNFFDKLFDTGTIVLHPYMKMKNVANAGYMTNYIKQLIQRARKVYY